MLITMTSARGAINVTVRLGETTCPVTKGLPLTLRTT